MLKNRPIIVLLIILMTLAMLPVDTFAATETQARPTSSRIILNGTTATFEAYNIDNYNYFKLRDLAEALNGGARQFEVTWDASKNAVSIVTGHAYTSVGGELAVFGSSSIQNAVLSDSKIYINGVEAQLAAYRINGNNYFKLRDIAKALDFEVGYDEANKAVFINTESIVYLNTQYGFKFTLPKSWENYTILVSEWVGSTYIDSQWNTAVETGPLIRIRHPLWTSEKPRQDIPIMVFTLSQWDKIQKEQLVVSAAPIPPSELGRNSKYVFALPARYNYSFYEGFEEVESIMESNPLQGI